MNKLRTLVIGIMAGGGIGAKVGAVMIANLNFSSHGSYPIEIGLLIGSAVGVGIAAIFIGNDQEAGNNFRPNANQSLG